jgi:hypothetical protein
VNALSAPSLPVMRLQRLPTRAALMALAISSGLVLGGLHERLPLWGIALAALLPWLPVWWMETAWQSKHYGLYALLAALTLFQLGHMMEHTAELVQLFLNHGNLAQSHGVFGVLDNEVVHFYWNIGVWVGTGILLYRFGARNPWLWIAFGAASLHMVEHFYLYWLYVFHREFWLAGGSAGILGRGGIIGSPLDRPYLHFAYNYFEVVPLVIAFWDQGWLVIDRFVRQAFPKASEAHLVAATAGAQRITLAPGTSLVHDGPPADRGYIVALGEVEVTHQGESGPRRTSVYRPGQLFEAVGPVRATQPTELLALERDVLRHFTAGQGSVATP